MTTLTGAAGQGKAGTLSAFAGIVVALAGHSGVGKAGLLTLPSFTIPNVEGATLQSGTLSLNAATFQVGSLSYINSTLIPLGSIITQTPIGGSTAVENSKVNLVISSGVPVPTNNPVGQIKVPNLPNKILPPDTTFVDDKGTINTNWWRFLANVSNQAMGTNQTVPATITVTASPFVFSTPAQGTLLVSGGPVTLIEYSKDQKTWYPTGVTQGQIQMVPNDSVRITYMNKPTLTFFPR